MKTYQRKLLLVTFMLLSLAALTVPDNSYAQDQPKTDCNVVRQVCSDVAEINYEVCVVYQKDPTSPSCTIQKAIDYLSCTRENNCN